MVFRHRFIIFVILIILHLVKSFNGYFGRKGTYNTPYSHQFQRTESYGNIRSTLSPYVLPTKSHGGPSIITKPQNMNFNFSYVGLKRIPENFITNDLPITLILANNEINKVSPLAFQKIPNLRFLDLSYNNISKEDILSIVDVGNLQTLNISNNKIISKKNTDKLTLKYEILPRLETLDLSNSELEDLLVPYSRATPALRNLYLSNNNIESSEVVLNNIPHTLTHIYLDNNQIDEIKHDQLRYLQEVVLHNNIIAEVCHEKCKSNYISLRGATSLKKLILAKNQISNVEVDAFRETKNLKQLDLSQNQITEVAKETFNYTPFLEELLLADNKLTTIPNICALNLLTKLNLSGNKFKTIHAGSFCPLKSLQHLSLANSCIDSVETHAFINFQNLHYLDLSKNQLKQLSSQWISQYQNLRVLQLEQNLFKQLEDMSLADATKLSKIYLGGNPISNFKVKTFEVLAYDLIIYTSTIMSTQENTKDHCDDAKGLKS